MDSAGFKPRVITIAALCIIADLLAMEMTYPFLPFMVRHLGVPEQDTGFYVGVIGTCFGAAQFLTSAAWGFVSDRIGRRTPLLVGLAGNLCVMLAFGFSSSVAMAAGLQAAQGVMNGNLGVLFATVSEAYTGPAQAKAFQYVGLAFSGGLMLATAIGGFTTAQTLQPNASPDSFLGRFPFAVPCLLSAAYMLVVWIITYAWLPETNRHARPWFSSGTGDDESTSLVDKASKLDNAERGGEVAPSPADDTLEHAGHVFVKQSRVCNGLTLILCAVNFLHWWGMMGYMQMFSVWATTDVFNGGLGFSSAEAGGYFVLWGAITLTFYLLVWPRVRALMPRAWWMIFGGMTGDAAFFLLVATLNSVASNRPALWSALLCIIMLGSFSINAYHFVYTTMLNATVSPRILGAVNGAATACMALGKATAPFTAGALYDWSVHSGARGVDYHTLFYVLAASQLCMLTLCVCASIVYRGTWALRLGA